MTYRPGAELLGIQIGYDTVECDECGTTSTVGNAIDKWFVQQQILQSARGNNVRTTTHVCPDCIDHETMPGYRKIETY